LEIWNLRPWPTRQPLRQPHPPPLLLLLVRQPPYPRGHLAVDHRSTSRTCRRRPILCRRRRPPLCEELARNTHAPGRSRPLLSLPQELLLRQLRQGLETKRHPPIPPPPTLRTPRPNEGRDQASPIIVRTAPAGHRKRGSGTSTPGCYLPIRGSLQRAMSEGELSREL
jgi:hypothetical protein